MCGLLRPMCRVLAFIPKIRQLRRLYFLAKVIGVSLLSMGMFLMLASTSHQGSLPQLLTVFL